MRFPNFLSRGSLFTGRTHNWLVTEPVEKGSCTDVAQITTVHEPIAPPVESAGSRFGCRFKPRAVEPETRASALRLILEHLNLRIAICADWPESPHIKCEWVSSPTARSAYQGAQFDGYHGAVFELPQISPVGIDISSQHGEHQTHIISGRWGFGVGLVDSTLLMRLDNSDIWRSSVLLRFDLFAGATELGGGVPQQARDYGLNCITIVYASIPILTQYRLWRIIWV